MNKGTKKSKSKNKHIKAKPILFNSWSGDYYSLGIFCQKTNLIKYARKSLSRLRSDTEESRLFFRGVNAADEWGFDAIAFEIYQIRQLTADRFDAFIYERAGFLVLTELKEAVADAHDWESEKQKTIGSEILDLTNRPRLEAMA